MKKQTLLAVTENLPQVFDFVEGCLEEKDFPRKIRMQIQMAVEEIFVNIAHYAYQPETGMATVCLEVQEQPLTAVITFLDQGIPYDPFAREAPDISLPVEEREIGGLGIYLVKKTMDDISYEYKGGQNILTLKKTVSKKHFANGSE